MNGWGILYHNTFFHSLYFLPFLFFFLTHTRLLTPTMSVLPAIISPSVLASDFGQLTAECKRMIKGGAEWLHMGEPAFIPQSRRIASPRFPQMSWTGDHSVNVSRHQSSLIPNNPAISYPTSPWASVPFFPRVSLPMIIFPLRTSRCPHSLMRVQGCTRDFYGLPHDGRPARKGAPLPPSRAASDQRIHF